MPTYAIGDIQGCFSTLEKLLRVINFDNTADTLWFTGDLVNRGPQSLETLRYIKHLGDKHRIVLGNHDLHLLAVAAHTHIGWPDDTLDSILTAPDRDELLNWLRKQPLLHHDENLNYVIVHAGFAMSWDLHKAKQLAHEVETVLQSEQYVDFFKQMYGNLPDQWNDNLTGFDRLRCITNYFTRVRFCYPDGRLELNKKGKIEHSAELIPWFKLPNLQIKNTRILFGHWAALAGVTNTPNLFALDTGCIWGYALTAMRLEDGKRFSVKPTT